MGSRLGWLYLEREGKDCVCGGVQLPEEETERWAGQSKGKKLENLW